jgi:hypothetical protein
VFAHLRLFSRSHLESARCGIIRHKPGWHGCLAIESDRHRERVVIRIVDPRQLDHLLRVQYYAHRRFHRAAELRGIGVRVGLLLHGEPDVESCPKLGVQVACQLDVISTNQPEVSCLYRKAQVALSLHEESREGAWEDPFEVVIHAIVKAAICGPLEGREEVSREDRVLPLYLIGYR